MSDPPTFDNPRRPRSRMVVVAIAFGATFAVGFALHAITSLKHVDLRREIGWTWVTDGHEWRVREVLPGGPAEGRLLAGDRIVALDGDGRIATVGPDWVLPHAAPGSGYLMTVARDGVDREVALRQNVVRDPSYRVRRRGSQQPW